MMKRHPVSLAVLLALGVLSGAAMAQARNPYGDGRAARRIAARLAR